MKYLALISITALTALLVGCGETTVLFLAGGKPLLFPAKGQVVNWVGPDGKTKMPVKFPIASPCEESANPTPTCTIKLTGYYPYECTGCGDPGLVVGSDSTLINVLGKQTISSSPVANSQLGAIYCKQNTAMIYPDPLSASATTADSVSTVQWLPAGGSGISNYTVTLQSGTCKEGTTINQTQNVCTLLVGAASQTYAVTADACSTVGVPKLTIH